MPLCIKAPRWDVIIINNIWSQEKIDLEKAKPIEYQNQYLIDYHVKAIRKRKQELRQYDDIFN